MTHKNGNLSRSAYPCKFPFHTRIPDYSDLYRPPWPHTSSQLRMPSFFFGQTPVNPALSTRIFTDLWLDSTLATHPMRTHFLRRQMPCNPRCLVETSYRSSSSLGLSLPTVHRSTSLTPPPASASRGSGTLPNRAGPAWRRFSMSDGSMARSTCSSGGGTHARDGPMF